LARAGEVFRTWQARLATLFTAAGVAGAEGFATTLIAASEGAVVLSRAQRSFAPFDAVHAQLRSIVAGQGD
jgi:hypothetical protein